LSAHLQHFISAEICKDRQYPAQIVQCKFGFITRSTHVISFIRPFYSPDIKLCCN